MPITVTIPDNMLLDMETMKITQIRGETITLEHSLKAIAKWESKWHIPFLKNSVTKDEDPMTEEQQKSYIECMCLEPVKDPRIFDIMPASVKIEIANYMDDTMTATKIKKDPNKPISHSGGDITSEQIYYMMAKCGIPFECENWHFNRLIMLIRVYEESENPRKMSKAETLKQNRDLNRARLASMKKPRRR